MKAFSRCYLAALFTLLTAIGYAGTPVEVTLHTTSILKKTPAGEHQMVAADIVTPDSLTALTIELQMEGNPSPTVLQLGPIAQGSSRSYIEIPVVKRPDSATFHVIAGAKRLHSGRLHLTPPRRWTVYDVQVSHHDLGYADYYHLMRRDVRELGLEMALDFCSRTDSWADHDKFRWTVETSEPMTKFISSHSPDVVRELARRIKEGRIALGGLHNSVYTEMMGYESMARLFYTPNRHICDLLGIPPSRTALITDVVGFARTLPTFLKEADIPYFYHGYNETVNGMSPASLDPVFYWRAHDGDMQKMPLFRSFPYYSPDRLTRYDLPELAALLDRYEHQRPWPYDCIIAEDSYDFSVPQFENVEGIRRWNEQFTNPVLISGTFTMFFDDVMKQADPATINVYDQDAPNAWADQDGTDAKLMGDARLLNFDLPTVEKLATIAFASGGKGYPWKEIWQAYHKLISYHEHTNGAFSEEDVLPIPFQKNPKAANANYYECEQVMHKGLVKEAEEFTRSARAHALGQFASLLSVSHDNTVVVFNPLPSPRSDIAVLAAPPRRMQRIVENASGKEPPVQIMPDGRLVFFAAEVPAMGYKTYRLLQGERRGAVTLQQTGGTGELENAFYRIRVDDSTGAIASIWDKRRGIELVDASASYGFNQYLYQRIEEAYSREPVVYRPRMISRQTFTGPLVRGITTRVAATGCESIEQSVVLSTVSDRIDFTVNLDKSASGRLLKQPTAQNKEALYYVFPFNIPGCTIHHELPGGVVEPLARQFPGSTSSFFGIQHFTDLSNSRYGVTLASLNAPLVRYGTPRPALWLAPSDAEFDNRKLETSLVSLYLMNNMFFTNIPLSQPGPVTFRWSLRAHDGDWIQGRAPSFAWETSHPLETMLIPSKHAGVLPSAARSFLSVDRENVVCSTFKPAEANGEGFILRFFEVAGRQTDVRLRLPVFREIARAVETNLVEVDRETAVPIEHNNELVFAIRPFGIKTIRVIPLSHNPLPAPSAVRARAQADREVELSWNAPPEGNVSYYRIHRDVAEDALPSTANCVGVTSSLSTVDRPGLNYGGWMDNRIEPNTTYFYRVQAVGHDNRQSPPGRPVRVTTLSSTEKNPPPHKVLGLAAAGVSPITDFTYISLLFYTNCESDVVRYRIYRNETPGFRPEAANLLIDIDARQKFTHVTPHAYATVTRALRDYTMIVYPDESVLPNRKYYYRVCAVDEAGQAGEWSDEACATAEVTRLSFAGSTVFFDSALVTIRPVLADGSVIRYTTDGSDPTPTSALYSSPFTITAPTRIKAALFPPGLTLPTAKSEAQFRRSIYPAPRYLQPYSDKWPGQGPLNLVDGVRGASYFDTYFQGFEFNDMDVVVDLGGRRPIREVEITALQDIRTWIFFPESVEFFVSDDGVTFDRVADVRTINENERAEGTFLKQYAAALTNRSASFVRVKAKNIGLCPPWHPGFAYKGKAWVFVDEIVIR